MVVARVREPALGRRQPLVVLPCGGAPVQPDAVQPPITKCLQSRVRAVVTFSMTFNKNLKRFVNSAPVPAALS